MAEPYDWDDLENDDTLARTFSEKHDLEGIPALDILKEAVREEAHFALWEVDYVQWPWTAYPDEALGD